MKTHLLPDEVGLPIIRAFGFPESTVCSLRLDVCPDALPTLTVESYARGPDGRYVVEPTNPDELEKALRRYRLVLIEDAS